MVTDADARGSEAVTITGGELVGQATSGGYGWRTGKSLANASCRRRWLFGVRSSAPIMR
jgi:dimethylglycine dehydrogenase